MTISINRFNNLVAEKLGDSDKVYWTNEEITRIVKESLLTFGAISGYWKRKILIETKNNQSFYDLLIQADVKTGFEHIQVSQTYQDIIDWLDDNLIGYISVISLEEIISLITNAINIFQSETSLVLARTRFNIEIGQPVEIDDSILDIVRAYYIDSAGNYHVLQLSYEDRISLVNKNLILDNNRPRFYSWNNTSASFVDIFPRPNENGYLELVHVIGKAGEIDAISSCLIPNNLVPYIRFKVLTDIFGKDGVFKDPFREAYCNKRWQEGLLIGKNYSAIINKKLDGINKTASSLLDFDLLRYGWLNTSETSIKRVNSIALGGYNVLAINVKPNNVHSILLEVIANAPIEDVEEDLDLQLEYIPIILDYCIHIASIKDGIAAIQSNQIYLENFIKVAVSHNAYLQRMNISYLDLLQKSKYPLKQAKLMEEEDAA